MAGSRLYLIDASIYFFRSYFVMPESWVSLSGYSTAGTMGYYLWLTRFLNDVAPENVVACFDESLGTGFRHKLYQGYKSSRALPNEALQFELLLTQQITQALGVKTLSSATYEADDLIATLRARAASSGQPVTIISSDKDLAQCVLGPDDTIWDYNKAGPMGPCDIVEKLGVRPNQVASYLALVGDTADDIPGVPQLGPKSAVAIFSIFSHWPELRENIAAVSDIPMRRAAFIASQIEGYKEQIDLAFKLTSAISDAKVSARLSYKRKAVSQKKLNELLVAGGLKSL